MIRSFIAIDLPDSTKDDLARLVQRLRGSGAKVSWVKPENIHLTLKFLGNVSPEQIGRIEQVLQETAASAAALRLYPAGCGAFPSLKKMRVVWAGLQGDEESLGVLQERVEKALTALGFPGEDRPFRAHVTLGRVKGKGNLQRLQELLLAEQNFAAEAFDVTGLVLYKSVLGPKGANYTPLFRALFGRD